MFRTLLGIACVWPLLASAVLADSALTIPIAPTCPPPEPCTVWTCLGLSHHNLKKCHCCFCSSRLGRMCDSVVTPIRIVTGGLVPRVCCDVPSREDLACMNCDNCSLAELVAAKIKRDEADACIRKAAVRFLGTVDCHYYHEAEEALIAHLRADQNECVRLEAAHVLSKGCCCTPRTIAALRMVVSGTAEDGNPPERSERVKAVAVQALHACLANFEDVVPSDSLQTPPLEVLPPPTQRLQWPLEQAAHFEKVTTSKPAPDAVLEAQRVYAAHVGAPTEDRPSASRPTRNLLQIVSQASAPSDMVETPRTAEKKTESTKGSSSPSLPAPLTGVPGRGESRGRTTSLLPIGLTPIGAAPYRID